MHPAIAENKDRAAMTRPQRFLRLFILLLAMHITAGASSAGEVDAILDAGGLNDASPAAAQDAVGSGPVCSGDTGSGCWQEIANLPGCYVWNPHLEEEETVTWSGSCVDGRVSGMGKSTWSWKKDGRSKTSMGEGPFVDGKPNGHWVWHHADGAVEEGPYVDGKRHGHWVWRFINGTVAEGPYVDGKRHGHWVLRWADGVVGEGPLVDGKMHGHWVWRSADGAVEEFLYEDGRRIRE